MIILEEEERWENLEIQPKFRGSKTRCESSQTKYWNRQSRNSDVEFDCENPFVTFLWFIKDWLHLVQGTINLWSPYMLLVNRRQKRETEIEETFIHFICTA